MEPEDMIKLLVEAYKEDDRKVSIQGMEFLRKSYNRMHSRDKKGRFVKSKLPVPGEVYETHELQYLEVPNGMLYIRILDIAPYPTNRMRNGYEGRVSGHQYQGFYIFH